MQFKNQGVVRTQGHNNFVCLTFFSQSFSIKQQQQNNNKKTEEIAICFYMFWSIYPYKMKKGEKKSVNS